MKVGIPAGIPTKYFYSEDHFLNNFYNFAI